METLTFIASELIYYLFLYWIVSKFNGNYLAMSCFILFLFSMLISLPSLISIKFIKNRKKYFIISNIFIIATSLLLFCFRYFSKNGLLNFTFYLYTNLFMLVPFFSLFTLAINKLCIPNKKRKQLAFLIVFKKIILILFTFCLSLILDFKNLIIIISILDFILNINAPIISNFLLKYLD